MVDGKCTKHFPKSFNSSTVIDDKGYPCYRRFDNGVYIEKNGVLLNNRYIYKVNKELSSMIYFYILNLILILLLFCRYVMPYNPWLLKEYHAHVNIER